MLVEDRPDLVIEQIRCGDPDIPGVEYGEDYFRLCLSRISFMNYRRQPSE